MSGTTISRRAFLQVTAIAGGGFLLGAFRPARLRGAQAAVFEPNAYIRITPDGEITEVADLSEGHLVPTGIAVDDDGNAYVSFETTPPYPDGASKVVQVTPDGMKRASASSITSRR